MGFLYECLSGRELDVADRHTGNYVPVLDPARELTAAQMINNARWRVRDNLLGDSRFSPQVYLTSATHAALTLNVDQRIARLEGQFSRELVMRSAVWLTAVTRGALLLQVLRFIAHLLLDRLKTIIEGPTS